MRLAVLMLGLLALATGCGTAPSSNSTAEDVAESTAAQDSSRVRVSYGGRTFFSGAFDYKRHVDEISLEGGGGIHYIDMRDATYVRYPERLFGKRLGEKRWIKFPRKGNDAKGTGTDTPFGNTFFAPFGPNDPTRFLAALKAVSEMDEGTTGVERGVKVTRYRAMLDVQRAADELPAGERDGFRAMVTQFWTDGKEIPLEIAVDGDGLLRRVETKIPDGDELSIEFFDYGLEVSPEVPPADEVMSKDEVAHFFSEGCSDEQSDGQELGKSSCIILDVGQSAAGSGGQRSLGLKEGK